MNLSLISPEGVQLDLAPNTIIQMEFFNTAFDEEILKGSYSYTFQLPQTSTNRLFFGLANESASNAGFQNEYPAFKLKSGLIEIECKLYLRNITKNSFEVNLFTASGAFANTMKKVKMNEVTTMGSETLSANLPYFKVELFSTGSGGQYENLYGVQRATIYWTNNIGITHTLLYGFQWAFDIPLAIQQLTDRINNYNPITNWTSTRQVQVYELVIEPSTDYIYRHISTATPAPVGTPLTDETYFEYVCLKSEWSYYRSQGTVFNWWSYDEFDMDKRVKAYALGNQILLFDPLNNQDRWLDVGQNASFSDFNSDTSWQITESFIFGGGDPYVNYGNAVAAYMNSKAYEPVNQGNIKFFPIHNPTWTPNPNFLGIVNYWKDATFFANVSEINDEVFACSAQVRAMYALEKLHEFLGLEMEDDSIRSNDFLNGLVVYNNFSNDRIVDRPVALGSESTFDAFAETFNFKDNLPSIPISEFINGFRSMFFLGCFFDVFTAKVYWKTLKSILLDFENAVDLTELASPLTEISYSDPDGFALIGKQDSNDQAINDNVVGDLPFENETILPDVNRVNQLPNSQIDRAFCLVKSTESWYKRVKQIDGTFKWEYYSKDLYNMNIENGGTNYSAPASTLLMYMGSEINIQDPYSWKVPQANQVRNSKNYDEKTECSLRFLSYAGIKENFYDANDSYPLATNNLYRDCGILYPNISGGSLKWGGEFGLYNQWGKEWLEFRKNAKQFKVMLPMNEVLMQKLKPWLMIKIGNQYFLQSNMKVNFPLDNGLAELTLYSIN